MLSILKLLGFVGVINVCLEQRRNVLTVQYPFVYCQWLKKEQQRLHKRSGDHGTHLQVAIGQCHLDKGLLCSLCRDERTSVCGCEISAASSIVANGAAKLSEAVGHGKRSRRRDEMEQKGQTIWWMRQTGVYGSCHDPLVVVTGM